MPANTEPTITLTRNTTERGTVYTAALPSGVATAVTWPGSATDRALAGFSEWMDGAAKRLRPDAFMGEATARAPQVCKAVAFDRMDLIRETTDYHRADNGAREPLASVSREWFARDVDHLRGMTVVDQMQHLAGPVSLETLTAYYDAGQARLGVNDQAWSMIDAAYVRANHIASTGMSANFPAKPHMGALLAHGIDQAALEAAADAVIAKHHQRAALIAEKEGHLRSVIILLAAVLAVQPETVLEWVLAA